MKRREFMTLLGGGVASGCTGAAERALMLPRVIALDRHAVRRRFEQRFFSTRMATDYVALYRSLLGGPSISEREKTVPLPPLLTKESNGNGPHGDRRRRAPETFDLF
jgi:hypothetical protein